MNETKIVNIFTAIQECDLEKILKLINGIQNINIKNQNGETPLFLAVDYFHNEKCESEEKPVKIVEALLKAGANPNIPNNEKDFPMHVACGYGALKIVNLLLDYSASIETKDGKGNTPLLFAARGDDDVHIAMVDALLKAGADINAENDEGDTALMYPCSWDLHKIISFLISKKIDIKKRDKGGNTGLIWAVRSGSIKAASILLKTDLDPYIMNNHGLSAVDYTEKSGNEEMIRALNNRGFRDVS